MTSPAPNTAISGLPAPVQAALEELRKQLVAQLGDALHAVVVHGSAVRGGYVADESDVDVLVVLARDDRALLQKIGQPLLVARSAARIECILLHRDEVTNAADVFPLLFVDIRACHALLHGVDPFAGLTVHDQHVRLRVEQELRDLRIRLRRLLAEGVDDAPHLGGLLQRKVKQLRSPLAALFRLRGETVDDLGVAGPLRLASAAYKVDTAPLLRVREDVPRAADALCALLDAAIADVDARDGGGKPA